MSSEDARDLGAFVETRSSAAFTRLASRHLGCVYRTCFRLLGNEADAEDAAQGVMIALARKADRIRPASLASWLHGAAVRASVYTRRGRASRRHHEGEAARMSNARMEDQTKRIDVRAELDAALSALSPKLRETLLRHYFLGQTNGEISRTLGVPEGTVAFRVHAGLEKLRKRLARRGTLFGVPALEALLRTEAQRAVPASLQASLPTLASGSSAVDAAAGQGILSPTEIAEGVLRMLYWTKTRMICLAGVFALLGAMALVAAERNSDDPPRPRVAKSKTEVAGPTRPPAVTGRAPVPVIAASVSKTADAVAFSLSPKKDRVAVLALDSSQADVKTYLHVVDLVDGRARAYSLKGCRIVPEILREHAPGPAWSRDGKKLLLTVTSRLTVSDDRFPFIQLKAPDVDVAVLDLASGQWKRLTSDGRSHSPLALPDGNRLVFARGASLYELDLKGRKEKAFGEKEARAFREPKQSTRYRWNETTLFELPYGVGSSCPLALTPDAGALLAVTGGWAVAGHYTHLSHEALSVGDLILNRATIPYYVGLISVELKSGKFRELSVVKDPAHCVLSDDGRMHIVESANARNGYYLITRWPRRLRAIDARKPLFTDDESKDKLSKQERMAAALQRTSERSALVKTGEGLFADARLSPDGKWLVMREVLPPRLRLRRQADGEETVFTHGLAAPQFTWLTGDRLLLGIAPGKIEVWRPDQLMKRFQMSVTSREAAIPEDLRPGPEGMVYVPGGPFTSGKPGQTREVQVPGFFIDRCEVSNRRFREYLEDTGRRLRIKVPEKNFFLKPFAWKGRSFPAGRGDHPIVLATYSEAVAYARWRGVRLPTRLEWEKAARGTDGRIYPWGNQFTRTEVWTHKGNCMSEIFLGYSGTAPVGINRKDRSPYGCLDMGGNVAEWVQGERTMGASWLNNVGDEGNDAQKKARTFSIGKKMNRAGYAGNYIGFRCVIDEKTWRARRRLKGKKPQEDDF